MQMRYNAVLPMSLQKTEPSPLVAVSDPGAKLIAVGYVLLSDNSCGKPEPKAGRQALQNLRNSS
jgi:hypothetical protein